MKPWKIAFSLLALTAPAPLSARASALLKPTSGVTQALSAKSLAIDTHLQGAFARTTVTTIYANPNAERIEADFLYTAPRGSVVTGFAYWYGKEKVVARVVEKGRAAKIYQYITSRMRDPALVEMIGKNAFRARIFPIEANADLKIEIQLAQTLPATKTGALWTYPLREETKDGALENFSLRLRSAQNTRSNFGAFQAGQLQIDKTNFSASEDVRALISQNAAPLRASLIAARDGGADGFFALTLTPAAALSNPKFALSGVPTYDLVMPAMRRLAAGKSVTIYGRYRGNGAAKVNFGGQIAKVTFPASVEKNNLASLLWASNRIEALSKAEKNRDGVMALSKRFGVPSKWTSWLAIPTEERANFKKQMIASDRNEAARLYAQAMARGDARGASAQRRAVANLDAQLEKIGRDYSSNEELLPLSSYLNEELKKVRRAVVAAKYGGATPKQRAQWQIWARNLQNAGAKDGAQGVEMPVYVLEDELRIASRLFALEVEAGREKGSKGRALQARLKELGKSRVARQYGWSGDTFAAEQAEVRANALAMEIATDRLSDAPQPRRQKAARQALARLSKRFGISGEEQIRSALAGVGRVKSESLAREIVRAEQNGKSAKGRAKLERFARLMEVKPDELLKTARTEVVRQDYNRATDELVGELLSGRENSIKAQQLAQKVAQMRQNSADWWQKDALNRASTGRAHQLAFQIEAEKAKAAPDQRTIADLTTRLQSVVTLSPGGPANPQTFLAWEKKRVAAGEKGVDLEPYRYRVAGLKPDDFRGGSYGAGDPLIALEAPADARSVVAIMPGGEVKTLSWRSDKNRWEANFDIPTYAALGDYLITVIVIEKDGQRRTVRLRFHVDGAAPRGQALLKSAAESGTLRLEIAASDDVERVTALLPWNERQILRRDASGGFASTLPIPVEWQNQKFAVRFILTDKAHNRTELLVDWN